MERKEDVVARWEEFFSAHARGRKSLIAQYRAYVGRLAEQGFPVIFENDHLADLMGVEHSALASMIASPSAFYRKFKIPKKRGGMRELSAPYPLLMQVQGWIKEEILDKITLHECAHAYVKGRSIASNASPHLAKKIVIGLDLQNFFPSVSIRRGISIFLRCGYAPNVSYALASLCFVNGELPQGAPTSPAISNIVTKRLDQRLSKLSEKLGVTYTRYADDLTFSGEEISTAFIRYVDKIVNDEGFLLNKRKTRVSIGAGRKVVTGISVSGDRLRLPRSYVRDVKKEAFFVGKFGFFSHSERTELYDPIYLERLLGRISFWRQIDPDSPSAQKCYDLVSKAKKDMEEEVEKRWEELQKRP